MTGQAQRGTGRAIAGDERGEQRGPAVGVPGGVVDPQRTAGHRDHPDLRHRIRPVGRINGRFASLGRPVIHYIHRPVPFDQLLGMYSAADVMVVTSLRDGMNLVAKEYVACHPDGTGSLVLSEFTGAATELDGAHLCNPHDLESVKRAIMAAANSTSLAADPLDDAARADARDRMRRMHAQVRDHDVDLWAESFLRELAAAHEAAR